MKSKKILAVLLAVLMILSIFAACGEKTPASSAPKADDTPASSTSKTDDTQSTPAADDIMTPYGRYPETLTLHTAKPSSSSPKLLPGQDVDNNGYTEYNLEKLNIVTVTDWEAEPSEYPNKLALMMTSDSLPDFFTLSTGDYLLFKQMLDNGKLADLTEAFDKCLGDKLKAIDASYNGANRAPFMQDGKLYGYGGGMYAYEHDMLWIRKDWVDASGLELPKTLEDMEAILTEWKNNPPSEEYVGMILNATDVSNEYNGAYGANPIFGAFGAVPKLWQYDSNGEIVYGSVQPGMKEGLKVLADWYQKGLIDPQFATRTSSGSQDALVTGSQSGMWFAPWWGGYSWTDILTNDPEADLVCLNVPLDANGKFNAQGPSPAGKAIVVNVNCEHPEAIPKMLTVQADMGRAYDEEAYNTLLKPMVDNGYAWEYATPTGGVNFEPYDIVPISAEICKYVFEHDGSTDGIYDEIPLAKPSDVTNGVSAYTWSKEGGVPGWTEYQNRYKNYDVLHDPALNIVSPAYAYTTDSMADLKPNLDTLEKTAFLKIVMGEASIDSFDQFVEDWYAQGGQTMTDEVRAMVG